MQEKGADFFAFPKNFSNLAPENEKRFALCLNL